MRRFIAAASVGISLIAGAVHAGPAIILKDTMGVPMEYNEIVGGERKIVFFWASWCHYCRKELDKLPEYRKFLAEHSIGLISVNVGEPADEVQTYKEKASFPYATVLDEETDLARHFNIFGIPTFIYFSGGKEVDRNNYFMTDKIQKIFKLNKTENVQPASAPAAKTTKERLRFK